MLNFCKGSSILYMVDNMQNVLIKIPFKPSSFNIVVCWNIKIFYNLYRIIFIKLKNKYSISYE